MCVGFSEFKNVDTLNKELSEKGLDYLFISSIEDLRKKKLKKCTRKARDNNGLYIWSRAAL